jgi:hypothetical protein
MKWRRVVVGLVVLALVAVLAVALWPRGPRPCRATFEQVREGMTYDEVCATVGGPPGVYSTRLDWPVIRSGPPELSHKEWVAADSKLYVIIDRVADRAIVVAIYEPPPDNRSPWDRLRDRLGL